VKRDAIQVDGLLLICLVYINLGKSGVVKKPPVSSVLTHPSSYVR
jgi:hypothetical protein